MKRDGSGTDGKRGEEGERTRTTTDSKALREHHILTIVG